MTDAEKQSSPRMSKLAGDFMNITQYELAVKMRKNPHKLVIDIRAMAASVVSQDEIAGDGCA